MKELPLTKTEKELYEKTWTPSQRASLHKGFEHARDGRSHKGDKDLFYQHGKTIASRLKRY